MITCGVIETPDIVAGVDVEAVGADVPLSLDDSPLEPPPAVEEEEDPDAVGVTIRIIIVDLLFDDGAFRTQWGKLIPSHI